MPYLDFDGVSARACVCERHSDEYSSIFHFQFYLHISVFCCQISFSSVQTSEHFVCAHWWRRWQRRRSSAKNCIPTSELKWKLWHLIGYWKLGVKVRGKIGSAGESSREMVKSKFHGSMRFIDITLFVLLLLLCSVMSQWITCMQVIFRSAQSWLSIFPFHPSVQKNDKITTPTILRFHFIPIVFFFDVEYILFGPKSLQLF